MNKDWIKCKLEDYINLIDYRGRTPIKTDNGIRLITAKNVKLGYLQQKPEEFIDSNNYEEWMRRGIPNYGDIIFTTEAPLGNVAQINTTEKLAFAQRIIVMQPEIDKINQNFLKYMFLSPNLRKNLFDKATGATVQGIKSSLLKKIEISFPKSIEEQKQIVEILDKTFESIDQAKVNIEKNIENTKELFQSRLNEIFSQKGDGWEEKTLKEVCTKITDGTHQTPKYFDSGYTFLSSGNVTSGIIDWDKIKYIDEKQHLEMQKRVSPQLNDILLAKNGTTGVAAMVDKDIEFDIYVSLALLRASDKLESKYLLHFVNSPIAKKQFNKRLKGSGVPNLHLQEIREVTIPYPISKKEQLEISNYIELLSMRIKELEKHYKQKLKNLEELKKSILQKAFSGELLK